MKSYDIEEEETWFDALVEYAILFVGAIAILGLIFSAMLAAHAFGN